MKTGEYSKYSVKVSDFGLSSSKAIQLDEKVKMPLRWSAPEALQKKSFTTMSDIYSYGVVLFEMFSYGEGNTVCFK